MADFLINSLRDCDIVFDLGFKNVIKITLIC